MAIDFSPLMQGLGALGQGIDGIYERRRQEAADAWTREQQDRQRREWARADEDSAALDRSLGEEGAAGLFAVANRPTTSPQYEPRTSFDFTQLPEEGDPRGPGPWAPSGGAPTSIFNTSEQPSDEFRSVSQLTPNQLRRYGPLLGAMGRRTAEEARADRQQAAFEARREIEAMRQEGANSRNTENVEARAATADADRAQRAAHHEDQRRAADVHAAYWTAKADEARAKGDQAATNQNLEYARKFTDLAKAYSSFGEFEEAGRVATRAETQLDKGIAQQQQPPPQAPQQAAPRPQQPPARQTRPSQTNAIPEPPGPAPEGSKWQWSKVARKFRLVPK